MKQLIQFDLPTEYKQQGDEVWTMKDNKPKVWYVWGIIITQEMGCKSEYGYPYDHFLSKKVDYILRSSKDNDYQSARVLLSSLSEKTFSSKEDLLKSL